jgi:hypothetical protein
MLTLALAAIIASAAPLPVSVLDQPAVDRCRARLRVRLGEIGDFTVVRIDHHRRVTTVRGSLNQLERPATAPPGMMTPSHVLATRLTFRCEVSRGKVRRTTLSGT